MDPNLYRYIWTHSRRDQIVVLVLIALSLPFYWLSLEVPKRIVNEALQGEAFVNGVTEATLFSLSIPLPAALGGTIMISEGWPFNQISYLFALSFLFLFYVLANGAFKYGINILKGMLSERMMRRLRFELFSNLMRFRPEDIRTVKPAEAASMIKDEVEPIGGFIGDAFIQPVFLGTQALTAVIFILTQSFWLGMVAVAVVLVQAFVIPYLRREQLRLGRLRQIASRRLAGRIGEMIDGSRTIQTYGLKSYSEAEIGGRLGELFKIRADLYKRKFSVKYLNNILAQVTPFFFYSIGGYLALRGSLDLGQLVAVIVAYRDLPPPIKELIDWDQRRADVTIKYEQVLTLFSGRELLPDETDAGNQLPIPADAPLSVIDLTVKDQRDTPLIAGASLTIARPSHVAIIGSSGSGRDIVARVLGRQATQYEGTIRLGNRDLKSLTLRELAREISYVPPEPELFTGSIRENVILSLKHQLPQSGSMDDLRWQESSRTGNPMYDGDADWCDYEAACVSDADGLERAILEALDVTGLTHDLYNYGLQGLLPTTASDEVKANVVAARHQIRTALVAANLDKLIQPFDFTQINPQATIGENLVFGVAAGDRLTGTGRAQDPFITAILAAEALTDPLVEIGLRIAENGVEVFSDLPSGHPLFERFSMIRASDLEYYAELLAGLRTEDGRDQLPADGTAKLIELALGYTEPRHRMGLMTPELSARILRARNSFREYLPQDYAGEIEFYDADRFMAAAPIRDNLLFGRVAQNIANAEQRVSAFLKEALPGLGMEQLVYSLGLDYDVGPRGQALFAPQRAAVSLARGLICNPQILILEDAFKGFGIDEAATILQRIKERLTGATLLITTPTKPEDTNYDQYIYVDEARVTIEQGTTPRDNLSATKPQSSTPTVATAGTVQPGAANMEAGE